ncbi:MAG: hypothetical protein WC455_12790 [Dehalococcoidia bacterium]|jgi:hypothetical protein
MFRIPKMMENRHCAILVHGISTIEIKISHITEQEVVGTYSDGKRSMSSKKRSLSGGPTRREPPGQRPVSGRQQRGS